MEGFAIGAVGLYAGFMRRGTRWSRELVTMGGFEDFRVESFVRDLSSNTGLGSSSGA